MKLTNPICISSRLFPAVRVGDHAMVSITYADYPGNNGRTRYKFYIDCFVSPDGLEYIGDDLQSGCQGGSLQEGLESLLSFLSACGESYEYQERTGRESENADLFPEAIAQWCADNQDELSMLAYELEETPNLIDESE